MRSPEVVRRVCAVALGLVTTASLVACDSGDVVRTGQHGEPRSSSVARGPGSASHPPAVPPPSSPASSSGTSPSPRLSRAEDRPLKGLDDWDVGARVLPLRPDGYGQVRRTPRELRERRMPTTDLLPPPPDERFRSRVEPVTRAWVRRERFAWAPGCPVTVTDLRLLHLTFRGFDGLPHTGRMVVHRRVARDVVGVFRTLYRADFPIEQMALARKADLDAPPTGDGNVTGAYACRGAVGSSTWSAHAYGLAVDVNPFMNPYRNGDLVVPELASAYLDRSWRRPGMLYRGGVVVRAFSEIGWTWGGDFRTVYDPMHFTATGR